MMLEHNVTRPGDPASAGKRLSRIDSTARHLLALINEILGPITRIEAGRCR